MTKPAHATQQTGAQAELFATPSAMPEGFHYRPDLIDQAEQQRLVAAMARLDFKPFEFHGFTGKREVISFGWRYNFDGSGLQKAGDIPVFLLRLRDAAAQFRRIAPGRAATRLAHELSAGLDDRMAQGPAGIRRCDRHFASIVLHVPVSPQDGSVQVAAARVHRRAAIRLSAARSLANRMGAQHPGGGCAALFHHLPHLARRQAGLRRCPV